MHMNDEVAIPGDAQIVRHEYVIRNIDTSCKYRGNE